MEGSNGGEQQMEFTDIHTKITDVPISSAATQMHAHTHTETHTKEICNLCNVI